jgi:hypothetical protein
MAEVNIRKNINDAANILDVRALASRVETTNPEEQVTTMQEVKTTTGTIAVTDPADTYGVADVLESTLRADRTAVDQADSAITKIDRSTYSALSNKLSKGTPSKYFVQRFVDKTVVTLYPTPDSSNAAKAVHIYFVKRIQDADSTYTDATDVPFRFVPCMVSGLAFYLSQKFNPQATQQLKLYYEDELARALSEDGSSTSVHITPKVYYPGT